MAYLLTCAGCLSTAEVSAAELCLPLILLNLNGIDKAFLSAAVLMKDRCKLFCRVAGSTAYYQLRDRVVDGTSCGPDTNDICVQGLCRVNTYVLDLCSTDSCGVYLIT